MCVCKDKNGDMVFASLQRTQKNISSLYCRFVLVAMETERKWMFEMKVSTVMTDWHGVNKTPFKVTLYNKVH